MVDLQHKIPAGLTKCKSMEPRGEKQMDIVATMHYNLSYSLQLVVLTSMEDGLEDLVFPVRHTLSMKRDLAFVALVFEILMGRSITKGRERPPSALILKRTFVEVEDGAKQ